MKIDVENTSHLPERKGAVSGIGGKPRLPPGAGSVTQEASWFATAAATLRAGGISPADRVRVTMEMANRFEAILVTPAADADELGIKIRLSLGEGADGLEAPRGTADFLIADVRRLLHEAQLTAGQPSG